MSALRHVDFLSQPLFLRGKVRDVFDLGDTLLIVATDRISAFDVVFEELIPDKGKVLNSIAAFWFDRLRAIQPNHFLSADPAEYPDGLARYADQLTGRSMLVRKIDVLPVECIVRGYLEGSALKEYRAAGTVGGLPMPSGMRQAERLPEPVFTPSTKAESGHDENISFAELENRIGSELAALLRERSLALYTEGSRHAAACGILLADTKFEFGLDGGDLLVADEILTPDSSRFWEAADYMPGRAQVSFDKQYLREWLETLNWDKNPPPPELPKTVIERTAAKYREAYARLTGRELA